MRLRPGYFTRALSLVDTLHSRNWCGIAGFVAVAPEQGTSKILQRMTEAMQHRGPDDSGFYHDEYVHLGPRRLSIIDVAGGHQPLINQTGRSLDHLQWRG